MKTFKKSIALLLTMLMILSIAPVAAFAETNDYKKITVTFDAAGGVCEFNAKDYTVGMEFGILPECEERDGYNFIGWYTEDGKLIDETSLVAFSDDITLHAEWEDLNAVSLNPFALIGSFFETIGNMLKLVVEFLSNMFSGTGNDALEQLK